MESTEDQMEKNFKTYLKNNQNDKLQQLLHPLTDKERYEIIWHYMVKKIKYFTESNFALIPNV